MLWCRSCFQWRIELSKKSWYLKHVSETCRIPVNRPYEHYKVSMTNWLPNRPTSTTNYSNFKGYPSAADPYENSCWWILHCLLILRVLWVLWVDRWIDRAVSATRAAYDASFAKLVALVAYRDSRRSESQRILCDLFHWLARFVFSEFCSSIIERFGCVWKRFGNFHRKVIYNTPRL